ncbi:MAG: hypothetical protein E7487_02460 [Ruminococcaceae bacterium]|nr:hypothetical protein [Oscillospiraceae bacterium]
MLYINQLDNRHIRYEHNVENGGVPEERRNVATSGCGLCCMCMVVDHLTTQQLTLAECVQLSYQTGANRMVGTRMFLLGPAAAERYGLEYHATGDITKMLEHLRDGGEAIINVGGDHDDHIGLYSHSGHYILALSYDGSELCILDPSYRENKYEEEGRKGKVRVSFPFTYCVPEDIAADTQNREIPYYLFKRK